MTEPYNAAERRHVREAAKVVRIDASLDREVVVAIMQHSNGRRWMWNRLEACHIFAPSHSGNALNTAFAEGERNIGLMFLADIMAHCPEQYIQMAREANDRARAAEARRKPPTEPESIEEEEEANG